ncbi:hypothetical protein AN958_11400 [Leucoagaricus sp. SymC.cos]|nr:hypothetical protein AN958_11400 [Leucoagaricus sp. SymC.cos]
MPHSPVNYSFISPPELQSLLVNPQNAWIMSCCLHWQIVSFYNNANRSAGHRIWTTLLGHPYALKPDAGAEGRRLTAGLHEMAWGTVPRALHVVLAYLNNQSDSLVTPSCSSRFELNSPLILPEDVIDGIIYESRSEGGSYSLHAVPDANLDRKYQPSLPSAVASAQAVCEHWVNPKTGSTWEYSAVPAAGITLPRIGACAAYTYVTHLQGPKLWLMWPGSTTNYEILCSSVFQSLDHQLSASYAIQHLAGLEVLLLDGSRKTSWYMPPGTIYASLTLSQLGLHASFRYMPIRCWRECQAAVQSLRAVASSTESSAASEYLSETLSLMPTWMQLAIDRRADGRVEPELEDWVLASTDTIEGDLGGKGLSYDKISTSDSYRDLVRDHSPLTGTDSSVE